MPKKLALLIIVSAFSMSLIACGGNEEMASHDDMEEMETAAPTSAGSTPTEAPIEVIKNFYGVRTPALTEKSTHFFS